MFKSIMRIIYALWILLISFVLLAHRTMNGVRWRDTEQQQQQQQKSIQKIHSQQPIQWISIGIAPPTYIPIIPAIIDETDQHILSYTKEWDSSRRFIFCISFAFHNNKGSEKKREPSALSAASPHSTTTAAATADVLCFSGSFLLATIFFAFAKLMYMLGCLFLLVHSLFCFLATSPASALMCALRSGLMYADHVSNFWHGAHNLF